jgi:hypothetical protein
LGVGGKSKEARVLYWIASYMIGACIWQAIVCFRNRAPFPFGCAWPVVAWVAVVSAPGPEVCNLAGWWVREGISRPHLGLACNTGQPWSLCRLSALNPTFPAAVEGELPGSGGAGRPVRWHRTPIPAPHACPRGPCPEIAKILKKTRHNYHV